MDEPTSTPDPSDGPARATTVSLPPPGGRTGRIVLAVSIGLLGLLQVAVGIQADRTPTTVIGAAILLIGVSLARRIDESVHVGPGGLSIPGWPRGADVPWSQVERLQVQPLPLGLVRLRMVRTDTPAGAPAKGLATCTTAQAERLLPRLEALAEAHHVPVVTVARGRA